MERYDFIRIVKYKNEQFICWIEGFDNEIITEMKDILYKG